MSVPLALGAFFIGFISLLATVWVGAGYMVGADPLSMFSGPRIYLVDYRGEITKTRERTDKNGVRWAHIYPTTRVGHVVLLADGAVRSEDQSYIVRWTRTSPPAEVNDPMERKNARVLAGAPQ